MKLLVLTALIAAVASGPVQETKKWPWQVGKIYHYNVDSLTWTKFEQSTSNGNAFKANFLIQVLEPGRLVAKLENPTYAQLQGDVSREEMPTGLNYSPIKDFDHPFEIFIDGGRVVSLKVPTTLSVSYENILKGLVSAIQVDLTPYNHVDHFPNSYDKETFQGLFKKTETDVTGECETLYTVSPMSAEWHRELPEFAEDPIEITKSKNYDSCKQNADYYFGVPEGAQWKGFAYGGPEKQFIKRTFESRILVGKSGPIYKSESLSSAYVSPLVFGKQKAEVYSYVTFLLSYVEQEGGDEWKKTVEFRPVSSLLFTFDEAAFTKGDKTVADAQKLLQEMTPLLQDPTNLPKADFLSKFNLLVRSIMFMNSEQLTQMSSSLEVARASKNEAKKNMWIIYRDAVAQAGTVAAFQQIKTWILTKIVVEDDAAELISAIASVLRVPNNNNEIVNEFFEFVLKPEVTEQKYLNNTALLAFTKFVSDRDLHSFTEEKVLPRLSQELKQAVETGDSNKAQVYVRVIGNLANPEILKVFAPYLEGKVQVSKYLRTQIVLSLKNLANVRDPFVRAVLFSLLKNTAEPYEVRVAAALNIFMAFPTPDMMQIMAHMSNDDPNTQVRAVLANSITFAAELKDPRFAPLAKAAKSVLYLVNKEKFGYRYSTNSFIDEYTSDDDIAHFREVSFIGSVNNVLPIYERGALRLRGTGWTEEEWFTLSVSDMQHFTDYITGLIYQTPNTKNNDVKYSAKKSAELLNIKHEHRCDLEGSFFLNLWNQQTLLTFNENDLNSVIIDYMKEIGSQNEENYNYTKVLTQKQTFVTFPLAAGVPFIFDYSEPTVIIMQSESKTTKGSKDKDFTSAVDTNFTYSRNLDGSVGFIDTFSNVYASSGIINKLQFYIPFKLSAASTTSDFQFKFNHEFPQQDADLFHLSVWPYTSLQKTDSLLTVSENKLTKYIEPHTKPVISADFKLGESTGTLFQVSLLTYSSDYKDVSTAFDADILTTVRNFLYQKDIALTKFNLKYLAKESENKDVTYTAFFDTIYKLEDEAEEVIEELEPAAAMDDCTPNSKARREEIVRRVKAGMQLPKVQLFDFSVAFDGKKKTEYVFTSALARSFVDYKTQGALFFKGDEQLNAVFKITDPSTEPLNFEKAIKNNVTVLFEADFKYGNTDNIHFEGYSERSKKYTDMLLNDPLGKQCLEETSKKNFYQKDCHKMIIKAHTPDYFKLKLTSKGLRNEDLKSSYDLYESYKDFYTWEAQNDLFEKSDNDSLVIEAQAYYYDNYINYAFKTQYGVLGLKNVEVLPYYPYAMSVYAPTTSWERARNWFTDYQHLPFCTVDDNKIRTFSGRSYDYSLTPAWHAVMVDEAKEFGNDLVILMNRESDNQAHVYVSYNSRSGKTFEIELTPKTIEVITNVTQQSDDGLTTYFDDLTKAPLLQYYTIAENTEFFSINDGAVRFIFDDHRLVIFTDDHRSTTNGLCGQSTTMINDDYKTPFGFVDRPDLYGASFSLEFKESEYKDDKTAELKKEAQLKAYQPVTRYTNILRSDDEWSKVKNEFDHHHHHYQFNPFPHPFHHHDHHGDHHHGHDGQHDGHDGHHHGHDDQHHGHDEHHHEHDDHHHDHDDQPHGHDEHHHEHDDQHHGHGGHHHEHDDEHHHGHQGPHQDFHQHHHNRT